MQNKKPITYTYTLEKRVFAAATFKVCGLFLFKQSKKAAGILLPVRVFFAFLEVRRQHKYWLPEASLVFYM